MIPYVELTLINIYWFCPELHPSNPDGFFSTVNRVLGGFDRSCHLFHSQYTAKWFALLLLALSCFGTKGVKNEDITWRTIWIFLGTGAILFFLPKFHYTLYIMCTAAGFICLLMSGNWISRLLNNNLMTDVFNNENESFMQETEKKVNDYSINLPTKFYYKKKWNKGWINVVNPFRATIVLGTPGSGKSYAVVNNFLKQQIEKGFALYCYDFKFADLSTIVYNHFLKHRDKYPKGVKFYVINFDDPRRSHRCNPIHPAFMTDIADAYESAYTIKLNLNKTWIQKQGDFFVESPIILLASIIWYLKLYKGGKYCTFPHAIEFLNRRYEDIFPILSSYPELENYLSPFMDAWQGGAADQLQVRP